MTVNFNSNRKKIVPQEHPLGCSVACVASLCGITYQHALKLFEVPDHSWIRGFYCSEIVKALAKANLKYKFEEKMFSQNLEKINQTGTIVFVRPNSIYPSGHFLLRLSDGWMNSWSNFPQMIPVKASLEKEIVGEVSYILYPV